MIEEHCHIDASAPLPLCNTGQNRLHTGQIIQSWCRNKFFIQAQKITRIQVVHTQLKIQNILFIYLQFPCQTLQEKVFCLILLIRTHSQQTRNRKHILLFIQLHAFVHVPIKMNRQIWDHKQGLL